MNQPMTDFDRKYPHEMRHINLCTPQPNFSGELYAQAMQNNAQSWNEFSNDAQRVESKKWDDYHYKQMECCVSTKLSNPHTHLDAIMLAFSAFLVGAMFGYAVAI